MTTLEELINDMLEFGICLENADRVAPLLLLLENDPRGFSQALLEEYPLIAERCGVSSRH